ncbi:MAG: STAS domain-containing protein [Pyrinomonadaceae bacterium]
MEGRISHFSFTCHRRIIGDVIILDLGGRVRIGDGLPFLHHLSRNLARQNYKKIVLNLENVPHLDARGVGELAAVLVTTIKAGGRLRIVHLSDGVATTLLAAGMLVAFRIFWNEQEALDSFDTDDGITPEPYFFDDSSACSAGRQAN